MNQLIQLLQELHHSGDAKNELDEMIMPNEKYWVEMFAMSMAEWLCNSGAEDAAPSL